MSQPKPTDLPSSSNAAVRGRVHARWQKLARLAVVAAAPVLNTACDPAPDPYCAGSDGGTWIATVSATAKWVEGDAGSLQIELTLASSNPSVQLATSGYTATGATIDDTVPGDGTTILHLTPGSGATEVKVSGSLNCEFESATFDVVLTLTGTPTAGADIPVSVH